MVVSCRGDLSFRRTARKATPVRLGDQAPGHRSLSVSYDPRPARYDTRTALSSVKVSPAIAGTPPSRPDCIALALVLCAAPAYAMSVQDWEAQAPAAQAATVSDLIEKLIAYVGMGNPGNAEQIRIFFTEEHGR